MTLRGTLSERGMYANRRTRPVSDQDNIGHCAVVTVVVVAHVVEKWLLVVELKPRHQSARRGATHSCSPPAISMPYAVAFAPTSASRLPMVCILLRAAFSSSRFSLSNLTTSSSLIASAMVTRPSYAAIS